MRQDTNRPVGAETYRRTALDDLDVCAGFDGPHHDLEGLAAEIAAVAERKRRDVIGPESVGLSGVALIDPYPHLVLPLMTRRPATGSTRAGAGRHPLSGAAHYRPRLRSKAGRPGTWGRGDDGRRGRVA